MNFSITLSASHLLLVEGNDDKFFFQALIRHLGLPDLQVEQIGGKDQLRVFLKALRRAPGFDRVVSVTVVRDADADGSAALQSVCDALAAAELARPTAARTMTGKNPATCAIILPDCIQGDLEDLCLSAVASDPGMRCVDKFFGCLAVEGLHPRHISKARVQAFLASRPTLKARLGEAAEAGVWPWAATAFVQVKEILCSISKATP